MSEANAYLVSPGLDIIEFAGDILLEKPEELSQNLIVFPGKRPGHFLRKYISRKLMKPFASPQILSMDEFIDFGYANLAYHDRLISAIDGVPSIFELNKTEKLINHKETPFYLDEFLPWGFKLFADFEELCIEEITPSKLKEIEKIAGEELPVKINENLIALSRLYQLFYERLSKLNLSTRSLRYQKVAQDIKNVDFSLFKRILFVGFFALTNSEKRMLSHFVRDNKVIFIFQKGSGIEETIKSLKLEVSEKNIEKEPPVINFYQTMDVHSEIFKLNQPISEKNKFDHKDVIVLPLADTLFPVIQHTVGFTGKDYNISMGYPLLRTPVYALIQTLENLLETKNGEEYYIPSYLKFVLHPYVKNIYLNHASYTTRIIFHTIEEQFASQQKWFVTLKEIEENKVIIKNCIRKLQKYEGLRIDQEKIKNHLQSIHKILVSPFEDIKNIEDFGDKCLAFFSFISENSPANLHPFTVPFIKTMLEAIYELKTSGLKHERFIQTGSYFRLLKNYVRTIRYPFSGTPVKGLQVLGFLETRNIKFDTIYLLDVNEGVIPNTTKEDTLLPHTVRKYLGLPTYEEREKIFNYYFETLLAGAKEANIFYIEGADKEKSRFVEKLLWEKQQKTGNLDLAMDEVFFDVQFSQEEPAPVKKTSAMVQDIKNSINFTPTKLDNYLACPLSFYYDKVLGLSVKEEIAEEPDAMKIGGIVHDILERFFVTKIGQPLTIGKNDYKMMDGIVEDIFEKTFQRSSDGLIYLFKAQTKKRMKDILDYHRAPEFSGTVILECEGHKQPLYKPGSNPLARCNVYLTSGETIPLIGKLDRVDKDGDWYRVIDYKTGTSANTPNIKTFDITKRAEWPRTLKSVQLPSYLIIYLANNPDITIERINACLMFLGGKVIAEKYLFPMSMTAADKQQVFESYRKAVVLLIEEILNLDIPFAPTDDTRICEGCDFKVGCGRQWMIRKW